MSQHETAGQDQDPRRLLKTASQSSHSFPKAKTRERERETRGPARAELFHADKLTGLFVDTQRDTKDTCLLGGPKDYLKAMEKCGIPLESIPRLIGERPRLFERCALGKRRFSKALGGKYLSLSSLRSGG